MKQIYIVTKLYNTHDRIASLGLCNALDKWIDEGNLPGFCDCFLPYRDSNEKINSLKNKNKTYEIFKMDCETVKKASIILGYFDGPSYDSGISFELGYAFVLEKPIILITTDYFQHYINNEQFSISPLVKSMADIIHIRSVKNEKLDYENTLLEINKEALECLKERIAVMPHKGIELKKTLCYDYFIDIYFSISEPNKIILERIKKILDEKKQTYYIGKFQDYCDPSKIVNIVKSCKKILIYGDSYELNVDSAILQGMAYGLEKEIILYSSSTCYLYQSDDFILYKNPMIEHSSTEIVESYLSLS